jgi:hypothetical protein
MEYLLGTRVPDSLSVTIALVSTVLDQMKKNQYDSAKKEPGRSYGLFLCSIQ